MKPERLDRGLCHEGLRSQSQIIVGGKVLPRHPAPQYGYALGRVHATQPTQQAVPLQSPEPFGKVFLQRRPRLAHWFRAVEVFPPSPQASSLSESCQTYVLASPNTTEMTSFLPLEALETRQNPAACV